MLPGPQPCPSRVLGPCPLSNQVRDPSNDRRTLPHIPDPGTIFQNVSKLPPAHVLSLVGHTLIPTYYVSKLAAQHVTVATIWLLLVLETWFRLY